MKDTVWIEAVRCERCGDITATEFTGPENYDAYQYAFPVLCSLDFVRQELVHPLCGGRILLSQLDIVDKL